MANKFTFTEEEQLGLGNFIKTDEFVEALAIAWRYSSK